VASTFPKCFENVKEVSICWTLWDLLFTQSQFCPAQIIEYLGFIINSQTMTISLTLKKKKKLKELCTSILSKKQIIDRRCCEADRKL